MEGVMVSWMVSLCHGWYHGVMDGVMDGVMVSWKVSWCHGWCHGVMYPVLLLLTW